MPRSGVRHRRVLLVLSVAGLLVCALGVAGVIRANAGPRDALARGHGVAATYDGGPPSAEAPTGQPAVSRLVSTVPRGPQGLASASAGQAGDRPSPSFTIVARKYEFSPARIRVKQDDLVKITLVADDIPHSFTLDALKIAKRAAPGHPAVFDFRADLPDGTGDVTYPFYCNLSIDEGCRRMRGELVIERKQ